MHCRLRFFVLFKESSGGKTAKKRFAAVFPAAAFPHKNKKTCLQSKQDIFASNSYCTLLTFLASLDFLRAAAFLEITPL